MVVQIDPREAARHRCGGNLCPVTIRYWSLCCAGCWDAMRWDRQLRKWFPCVEKCKAVAFCWREAKAGAA